MRDAIQRMWLERGIAAAIAALLLALAAMMHGLPGTRAGAPQTNAPGMHDTPR